MTYLQRITENLGYITDQAVMDLPNFAKVAIKESRYALFGPFYRWAIFQPPPTFVIICRARTGSNFLLSLLDTHPKIRHLWEPLGDHELKHKRLQKKILREGCIPYLERRLQRRADEAITGFKVLYHQLEELHAQKWGIPDLSQVLTYLQQHTDCKIIHLKRRNRLESLVSHKIAATTQRYVIFNPKRRNTEVQIELSADECEKNFAETGRLEEKYDQLLCEHPTLELFYEDLTTNTHKECKRILYFLGVEYHPLQSLTIKQNVRPMNEVIKNYGSLKQYFAETPWAIFFKD